MNHVKQAVVAPIQTLVRNWLQRRRTQRRIEQNEHNLEYTLGQISKLRDNAKWLAKTLRHDRHLLSIQMERDDEILQSIANAESRRHAPLPTLLDEIEMA